MDHQHKLQSQIRNYLLIMLVLTGLLLLAFDRLLMRTISIQGTPRFAVLCILGFVAMVIVSSLASRLALQPVRTIMQAVLHISGSHNAEPAPNLDKVRIGRDVVSSLCLQIYQLASTADTSIPAANPGDRVSDTIARSLPLPFIVADKDQTIRFVNDAALEYFRVTSENIVGQNMYGLLDLMFSSDETLDSWLADCRANKVTANRTWERVRLRPTGDDQPRQFDLAAFYNKDNPSGVELILTMFDHTERYAQDDQGISFVALAVHELRTPLTLLRGYVEVFEDEFEGKLDDELAGFMHKMQASAQSLSSFVSNILNVARIEEDQLLLRLNEEKWEDILRAAAEDMRLRAQVHNKVIELDIAPDLPTVAVDRVSIAEVLNNLMDNAIKYSGTSQTIKITTRLNQSGLVETSVQDFGIGIDGSILSSLFEKFYRNHRSRAQVGGTGLGLYLSKAIVSAHDGNIWVDSAEGKGSTFTFTVQPYAMIADRLKNGDNMGVTRGAHGWIKNHSLYRR